MATRLPSGKYRAQVLIGTDENGKRLYESFIADTADEADYEALAFKLGKGKGRVERKNVTLRAAMEAYITSREGVCSPSTIETYRKVLRNFGAFLDTRLDLVTKMSLQLAISEYSMREKKVAHNGTGQISPKTVRCAYGLINSVLLQNGIRIDGIRLPPKKKITYATPFESELAKIFAATKGKSCELPVLLAVWCSLRRGEVCGLRYDDVDFERKTIHVSREKIWVNGTEYVKPPKTYGSDREVFLPDYIANLIREKKERDGGEYIITVKGDTIGKGFDYCLRAAGIPHCRFHDLRHAFVSVLHKNGLQDEYLQAIGGWESPRIMNEVYKQQAEAENRKRSARVDEVFMSILQHVATLADEKSQ